MLTLLEEVVLLTIDPRTGQMRGDRQFGVQYALAGAVLFDLALAGRIDTDVDSVTIVNKAPTGNRIQDELLAELSAQAESFSVREWVEQTFRLRKDLEGDALAQLIERGIIRLETSKLLWVIDVQRFPLVDGKPQQLVKERLAQAILTDEIPDTRDIMLVSLADACGLLTAVLSQDQIDKHAKRIETLSQIETISRNVATAIAAMFGDLARSLPGPF